MKKYEITFIVSENHTEDRATDIAANVRKLIEVNGGKVEKEVFWGKRKLIYKIAKNGFGYYYVFIFDIEPEKTNKLNKELNLNEKILRYLIVDFIEGSPFFEEGAREKEKERGKKDSEEMAEKKPRRAFKKREVGPPFVPLSGAAEVKEIKEEIEKKKPKGEVKEVEEIVGAQPSNSAGRDFAPEQDGVETEKKGKTPVEKVSEEKIEKKKEKEKDRELEERKPERKKMTEEERKEQLEKKLVELLKDEEL